MTVNSAYEGEDVPITIIYDNGGTDPDDTNDDGDPEADISIIYNDDGTTVVDGVSMSSIDTGELEYVWDTEEGTEGTGTYIIEIAAEFDGETKISKDMISLR